MADIEQRGSFYLGRKHDLAKGKTQLEPLLYDSNDLTTHAVCVGMTGSGKTGLCVTLLEEAALDGIPAIAIDPKGDLGNLLLAFPKLEPNDFRPWVDTSEANRRQMSPDAFAADQAKLWRDGLAKWDQQPDRIRRYCDTVDRVIYTPGSSAGIPITVLKSFQAPSRELVDDADALSERVAAATSGLLALLGVDADPIRSREHIFLSNVFATAWRSGRDLSVHQLIEQIQRPPFSTVGVVDLESFYPASERYKLAMNLNNLLASPSFASWMTGQPLDIQQMLYTPNGKPRLAVVSIAHLDDAQRMFFVTILLNEVLSWVRSQPGTGSLRALLYMDEVFGYFPPLSNPPSKRPMLTLLKQARAYGLGCILATQNPVDLDYKGLSNAGTWFLGRLQTERDKSRVIEGLEGASAEAGASFDRQQMEATLAALGQRVFLMNNVHENAPVVFHTRWAMSYLCGPLTRGQIKTLMDPVRSQFDSTSGAAAATPSGAAGAGSAPTNVAGTAAAASTATKGRPVLPAAIPEKFAAARNHSGDGKLEYRPAIAGEGKVHFVQAASGIDEWRDISLLATIGELSSDDVWTDATRLDTPISADSQPVDGAAYRELPSRLAREKSYPEFRRQLAEHLYRTTELQLWRCETIDATSKFDESEVDFRKRIQPDLAAHCLAERDRVEKQFAPKLNSLEGRIDSARAKVSAQKWQFWTRATGLLWVVAEGIMRVKGIGRRGRPRSAETAVRGVATEHGQQATAQASLDKLLSDKAELERQRDEQLAQVDAACEPSRCPLERIQVKPRKSDIEVDSVALLWLPYQTDPDGRVQPLYETGRTLNPDSCTPILPTAMSERERWVVYPLLFLALGAALRDKLFDRTISKSIVCEELTVVDEGPTGGQPVLLAQIGGVDSGGGTTASMVLNGRLDTNIINAKQFAYRSVPFVPFMTALQAMLQPPVAAGQSNQRDAQPQAQVPTPIANQPAVSAGGAAESPTDQSPSENTSQPTAPRSTRAAPAEPADELKD